MPFMKFFTKLKILSLLPLLVACAPAPHAMDNQPRTVENKPQVNGKPECAIFQSHGFVCPELMLSNIDVNSCQFIPNPMGSSVPIIDCAPIKKDPAMTNYAFQQNGSVTFGIQ